MRGWKPGGTIKIDDGEGSDTIDTTLGTIHETEHSEFFLTGGGPERDRIVEGKANYFVVVENDDVKDEGGTNTFLVKGGGTEIIETGRGAGLVVVNKKWGPTLINPYTVLRGDDQKLKRIVFESGSLTKYSRTKYFEDRPFTIRGSPTPHDVLSMKNFKPVQSSSSSSSDPMVVLVPDFGRDL